LLANEWKVSSRWIERAMSSTFSFNSVFSPLEIGNMTIKNRFVVSPMVTNFCTVEGDATETYIAYHEERAKGGWGLIITEDYAIDGLAKSYPYIPGLWDDDQIRSHRELTERVHAHGTKILAQIFHPGRQTQKRVTGADPKAPSAIPCPVMLDMPHALTVDEIQGLVGKFGDAALRAKRAGFDGIEIHGAHGYLISEFMSPYSNKRIDKYGGCLENRMLFALEIIADIREKCGKEFVVDFRISGDELVPGGRNLQDTKAICLMLQNSGIDALHISVGVYGSWYSEVPPAAMGHGWIADFAGEVKKVVRIPVFAVGRINDPYIAEAIIASGKADVAVMGRASLADPDLPNKTREGRLKEIIHCTACLQGCTGRIDEWLPLRCVLNPRTGREKELTVRVATKRKRVLVAGAGPAGMEAAIVAAERGHDVEIFERSGRLGGAFYLAAIPPWKGEIADFLSWQVMRLEKHGVKININAELTTEIITAKRPDVVIVATGSGRKIPEIDGIGLSFVAYANDALEGKIEVGKNVAIIGGGMIGAETANHFATHAKKVTIIEELSEIASEEPPSIRRFMYASYKENAVELYTNCQVERINEDRTLDIARNGQKFSLGVFDNVLVAVGSSSVNDLETEIAGTVGEVYVVGDARKVRKALDAIAEGFEAGMFC
jgi:2,4-dienoyl-CoA reductase-like NADH-dependent reductase (Old Yellow Enzyme family)/thioredoxin reductase